MRGMSINLEFNVWYEIWWLVWLMWVTTTSSVLPSLCLKLIWLMICERQSLHSFSPCVFNHTSEELICSTSSINSPIFSESFSKVPRATFFICTENQASSRPVVDARNSGVARLCPITFHSTSDHPHHPPRPTHTYTHTHSHTNTHTHQSNNNFRQYFQSNKHLVF